MVQTNVVDGIGEAAAHELGPDAVDDRLGEIGVLGFRNPVGKLLLARKERLGGILVSFHVRLREVPGQRWFLEQVAAQETGRNGIPLLAGRLLGCGAGKEDFTAALLSEDVMAFAVLVGLDVTQANKEPGHAIEIGLLPFVEGMVVAAGAMDLRAEKDAADRLRGIFGPGSILGVEHGRAVIGGAVGQQQFASPAVVGLILGKLVAQPLLQSI